MDLSEGLDPQGILDAVMPMISTYGLKVIGAIVLLIVGRMVAGAVRGWLRKALDRSKLDATLVPFVTNLFYYLILIFVVVAVLGVFGIPTASVIAVLGAAGLAVGLALQGTLGNFAAGVMLLIFRPFKVGEYVDAGGTAGSVVSIGVFSTTMNTPDNVRIVVPNSSIYGQTIRNYSANDTRRNDMVIGVSYADDLGRAIETVNTVLGADSRVLKDPEPTVAVAELADSSVNLVVRPWCKKEDYWGLRFDLTRKLKEELERSGCSIPFPQTDVHVFPVEKAG